MEPVEELRLIVPPGMAPRLRVHPLLRVPSGGSGVHADFAGDELRLSSRGRASLLRLALDLTSAAPLRLKMHLRRAAPRHAINLDLSPEMAMPLATQSMFGECLSHLLDNVAAAGAGEREGIHQARVAIRRLRAALQFLRPRLDHGRANHFDQRLRQLGHDLGGARDWDVFLHETFRSLEQWFPDEAAWLGQLRAAALQAQATSHAEVAVALAAPSFTHLVLALASWIEDGPTSGHHSLGYAAPLLLDRMAGRVARRGRRLAEASPDELHDLRKALKKLRYSVEFTAGLYRLKPIKPYLRALKNLQSTLGDINDAQVTLALTGDLDSADGRTRVAIWSRVKAEAARRRVRAEWEGFIGSRRPWQV